MCLFIGVLCVTDRQAMRGAFQLHLVCIATGFLFFFVRLDFASLTSKATITCTNVTSVCWPCAAAAAVLIICHEKVEVTYWDEEKFNQRVFTDEGNDEMMQAASAAHAAGM